MENNAAGIGIDGECPVCDGTGVELTTDALGRSFSRPCAHCGALERSRMRQLKDRANVPKLPKDVDALPMTIDYVNSFHDLGDYFNWILFSGRTGCGKTTNAAWLTTQLIERYKTPARFYSAYEITRRLATCKNVVEHQKMLDDVVSAPFVVLDDFLKVFPRPESFQYADMFEATLEIIWSRNDARRPTCITTQRDFKHIAAFDAALAGRIVENCAGRIATFGENATNRRLCNAASIPLRRNS